MWCLSVYVCRVHFPAPQRTPLPQNPPYKSHNNTRMGLLWGRVCKHEWLLYPGNLQILLADTFPNHVKRKLPGSFPVATSWQQEISPLRCNVPLQLATKSGCPMKPIPFIATTLQKPPHEGRGIPLGASNPNGCQEHEWRHRDSPCSSFSVHYKCFQRLR